MHCLACVVLLVLLEELTRACIGNSLSTFEAGVRFAYALPSLDTTWWDYIVMLLLVLLGECYRSPVPRSSLSTVHTKESMLEYIV